ncbi:MAG: hypothetical protein DWQ07_03460 [Chloroflexi bacterium]|nr:MAG: hypothetical protein DWQ07_03460 [Chloroflexota bacterium]MBL1193441.1 hypothetical protein [Chloroflexota bacterium]NOH10732.1 hypothetical protein [Chloroflexota bacterium]
MKNKKIDIEAYILTLVDWLKVELSPNYVLSVFQKPPRFPSSVGDSAPDLSITNTNAPKKIIALFIEDAGPGRESSFSTLPRIINVISALEGWTYNICYISFSTVPEFVESELKEVGVKILLNPELEKVYEFVLDAVSSTFNHKEHMLHASFELPTDLEDRQRSIESIEAKNAMSEIQRAKRLLQEHDDYPDLLNGLRLARKFISERPNHPGISGLQNFIDEAEKVRREIAYKIEGAQTMGAMQQFEEQVKAYAELIDKQVFRVEDPDDPTKEVSIAELQQKALENLRQARESTVKDRCAEAEKIIESEPGVALLYLEQLSEFIEEFKGLETYYSYSKVKLKADSNHKKWLEVQEIIKNAAYLLEPRTRLAEYQKARNIFPGFTALPELIGKTQTELRVKLKQAATIKLNAALRQLKFNLQSIPFREIDQELRDVEELIRELGDPEGVLIDVQKDLDDAYQKLGDIESRHIAIKVTKEKIESGLKKDPPDLQALRGILEDLPEEDQAHALLRDIHIRIEDLKKDQS